MINTEEFLTWATIEYNQFQKEDSVLFASRATPKGLELQNTFVNVTAEDRRQNLDRMLSKTSVSCLDLSISAAKAAGKSPAEQLSVECNVPNTDKTYDDIEDKHECADCTSNAVRPKNIGSICHPECKKACQFHFFSYKGCDRGFQCDFCHEGHVSNRKAKAKSWIDKQNARAREKEEWKAMEAQRRKPRGWVAPQFTAQNDAIPIPSGYAPVPVTQQELVLAPVQHVQRQCGGQCQNCGCHGQLQAVMPRTVLVPQFAPAPPSWYGQPAEYFSPQWQSQPEFFHSHSWQEQPIYQYQEVPPHFSRQAEFAEFVPQWQEVPQHYQQQEYVAVSAPQEYVPVQQQPTQMIPMMVPSPPISPRDFALPPCVNNENGEGQYSPVPSIDQISTIQEEGVQYSPMPSEYSPNHSEGQNSPIMCSPGNVPQMMPNMMQWQQVA
jgi:hypothetical protein